MERNDETIKQALVDTVVPPSARTTIAKSPPIPELLPDLTIDTPEDYKYWGAQRVVANDQIKELTAERLKITRPMDAAKKAVMAFFDPPISLRESFVAVIDPKLSAFKRKEQAEKDRVNREAAEAARLIQQKMLKRAEEKAAKLQAKGDTEGAAELLNRLPLTPEVPAFKPASTTKVAGLSTSTVWKAEITDPKLLLEKHPEYFLDQKVLDVITSMLSGIARSTRGTAVIPGVRLYPEDVNRS
ncbi:MAG: hypothetical protein WC359_13030 [Dehalococcoidia bacterium]|jgi:hypothetical protein